MFPWSGKSPAKHIDKSFVAESKAFCIMPWVHFHVTQHGTVTPCCQAPWQAEHSFGDINQQSVPEIWDSKAIRAFRKTMIRDEKDNRCERCYIKEDSGWKSLRQITNEKYLHQLERVQATDRKGRVRDQAPIYLDIRFSNICNLKCRICGPWSSSQWFKDAVALGMVDPKSPSLTYATDQEDAFFAQLEALGPELEEIYFAGGEPLLMEQHYRLLDLLIEKGYTNLYLQYNTNFSTLKLKEVDVVEKWKHFRKVGIAASLDGMGPRGEYLRKNLNWEQVVANRKRLLEEAPNTEFFISPTLCIFNLLHIPDFHQTWVSEGFLHPEDFYPSLLVQPEPYNIRVLPEAIKAEARHKYQDHLKWLEAQTPNRPERLEECLKMYHNLLLHLDSADMSGLLPEFRERTAKLDKLRQESFVEVFPELAFLIQ